MMHESPGTLQDACLNFICDNIHDVCRSTSFPESADKLRRLTFSNLDIHLHSNLSDELLCMLGERNKLTDETLLLFDNSHTCLRKVKIKRASVTTKGLRVLKPHWIVELEAIGLKNVTVNDLVGCLGEWTLQNLKSLNVMHSSFINWDRFCVVVSLTKLRSLQTLNVSHTEFNKHGLDIITEDLPALENLDISGTLVNDLSPLRKCKNRLKSLTMYNLRASHNADAVSILCELTNLRHLDISEESWGQNFFVNLNPIQVSAAELLSRERVLPNLTSLDISGKEGIYEDALRAFIKDHPKLCFLGLAQVDVCHLPMFTDPASPEFMHSMTTTGNATETQIAEALRRYSHRAIFLHRTLDSLFNMTSGYCEPKVNFIKAILPVMRNHPLDTGVQTAATACFYNLTKAEKGQKLHPKWLTHVVNATLNAMENFPNHLEIQKNSLLTLCSGRILTDVIFDRFRCAELVMDCLCTFRNSAIVRMSVTICSILAAKISAEQTSQLGSKYCYMKRLLTIVESKTQSHSLDPTMTFTLSALWNLTDESPSTCKMFLELNGLDLYIGVLQTFATVQDINLRVQIETKVLGLINNLAEVQEIRSQLMIEPLMVLMRDFLHSDTIDVSYFAAGIFSHILSDRSQSWHLTTPSRQEMLQELAEAVLSWEEPRGEMVAYRSFKPFFPLLTCFDIPEVQLWAVWAMQHVCSKNGDRYGPMLIKEGVAHILQNLIENPSCDQNVVRLASSVLCLIDNTAGMEWNS